VNTDTSSPLPDSTTPWRCAALALAGLIMVSSAQAQRHEGKVLPEALKGVAPAGRMCLRDEAPASIGPAVRAQAPDLSCAMAVRDLASLMGRPDTTVVDVRPAAEHEAFRLRGSLNMAASALRTRTVLKSKTIVLVGSGKGEIELYAACASLRGQGFRQVRVLRGGMASWLSQGQPVDGIAPDAAQLSSLSAAQLWAESRFDANVVLLHPSQEALQQQLPFGIPLRDASASTVKAVLERRRKELKNAPLASVVLAAAPDSPAAEITRLREALHPVPLLVYAEAPASFAVQMTQLNAAWAAQARGPRQPGCGL
jgi:rhodanese-related sulfurtransferase